MAPFQPVGLSPSADPYLVCRNIGIAVAITDKIGEKQDSCAIQCSDAGSDIGELQGQIYCGLFMPYATQPSLCSFASRQGCHAALRSHVASSCPNKANADPDFDAFAREA